jgi:hypothetical protein
MPESHPANARRLAIAALVALAVVARSAVFVFWEQAHFDADQAITGLMAKHIVERRAFPVFYYGQAYMLGVEAWLAAPLFLVAGVSVAALKLPLLVVNVAIALMLLRIFQEDVGLTPALSAVPALFFALAPPGTAALLLSANGGNVEPLAYTLLLWLTRRRPNIGGFIFGIGFLQREFTIYGLAALLVIEAANHTLFTREGIRRRLIMLRAAAEVWLVVQWLKHLSSALGPGTTFAQIRGAHDNVIGLANRICVDFHALPSGILALFTDHWPTLFGTRPYRIADFGIESSVWQGLPFSSLLLGVVMIAAAAGVIVRLASERTWRREYDACAYLVLVGLFSAAGYVLGRCGQVTYLVLRYELLSLVAAGGLAAWFLRAAPWPAARAWIAAVCLVLAVPAAADVRLLAQYLAHAPVGTKQIIVRQLESRGIRYATADYWIAYAVTFLAHERVIVASDDVVRIDEYQRIVNEHIAEAVTISRTGDCDGARPVPQTGVYFCPAK